MIMIYFHNHSLIKLYSLKKTPQHTLEQYTYGIFILYETY